MCFVLGTDRSEPDLWILLPILQEPWNKDVSHLSLVPCLFAEFWSLGHQYKVVFLSTPNTADASITAEQMFSLENLFPIPAPPPNLHFTFEIRILCSCQCTVIMMWLKFRIDDSKTIVAALSPCCMFTHFGWVLKISKHCLWINFFIVFYQQKNWV